MLTRQKIPASALKEILSGFVLGKITKIETLLTSGNITYIIQAGNGKYILRLSPLGPRWRSRAEILAEIELLNYLADNNFPVVHPLNNESGEQIISWKNHHGYLRQFIIGKAKINPTVKEIKEFGALLGRFHKLIEGYKTKNKRRHAWGLSATKAHFLSIKKDLDKQFVSEFENKLSALHFPKYLPSGSIHEDLGKRHVIWREKKIVSVLDFDRFYFGPMIFDLGQAIRGWCFINNWQTWSQANFIALLSGYQKQRHLSRLEKKYLVDSIKFAVLERALSFYARYVKVTKDVADKDFAWLSLKRLIEILDKVRDKIEESIKK
jgi:homoserine kinase type II